MSTISITPNTMVTRRADAVRAQSPAAHLRITRRGRVVLSTLVGIPVVALSLVFGLNSGGVAAASHSAANTHFDYVTVQQGQSLWSIAERISPSSDPRDVISDVMTLNSLDSATVTPGERLAIPTKYEH